MISRQQDEGTPIADPLFDLEKSTKDKEQYGVQTALTEGNTSDQDEFPEGGFEAWMVAVGAACILFCTSGYTNTYGVFQAYYTVHKLPDRSPDDIAWIGSLQAFLTFATAAIGGPLFDRYGAWVIRPAAIAYLFAIMMTSICTTYWQLMLSQGVLHGIASGCLMWPAVSATPQYFRKKRGLAIGASMTGSSIGAIIFPVVLSKLLNDSDIGFGWSLRIVGFIMALPLIIGSIFVKARLPPRKTRFLLPSAFRNKLYDALIIASFFLFIGMFTPVVFLPTYGQSHGMSDVLASYLVAMINGASIFGRILPGILGDKFGQINALFAASVSTAVMILCWPKAESTAGIIVFAIFFGFCSGAIVSGSMVMFTLCPENPQDLGTYIGMGTGIASIAVLIGPPICGVLIREYEGFDQVSIFGGVLCMVGAIGIIFAKTFTPHGVFGKF